MTPNQLTKRIRTFTFGTTLLVSGYLWSRNTGSDLVTSPLERGTICLIQAQILLYFALVVFLLLLGVYQGFLDTAGEKQND